MLRTQSIPSTSTVLLLSFMTLMTVGCQADGDNRGARRGAAGGALVGLTMGALTGDAELAMKGAVAGGVAGGVAGSMTDLESDRETERTAMMSDAIAGRPSTAGPVEHARPQTWDRLDGMIGEWNCSIWGLDAAGQRITATASCKGELVSTKSVKLNLLSFDADQFGKDFDDEFGDGFCQLSYDMENGYEILNGTSHTAGTQRWVGERLAGDERYSFYYVAGGKQAVGNARLELRFVGKDMFMVQTFVSEGSGEKQIQEYRFTRK